MKLLIKNMVSLRCKRMVEEFKETRTALCAVNLGEKMDMISRYGL